MMPIGPATRIYLAAGATDLRKGFEGLSDLVRHRFQEDPLSGHLFAFANRPATRIKLMYWNGTGTWLCARRERLARVSWTKAVLGGGSSARGRPAVSLAGTRRPWTRRTDA